MKNVFKTPDSAFASGTLPLAATIFAKTSVNFKSSSSPYTVMSSSDASLVVVMLATILTF
ncbi:hypothetical protein D3C79_955610 [compost metagenome]